MQTFFKIFIICSVLFSISNSNDDLKDYYFEGKIIQGEYPIFKDTKIFKKYEDIVRSKKPVDNFLNNMVKEKKVCYIKQGTPYFAFVIEQNKNIILIYDKNNKECSGFTYSLYFSNPEYINITKKGKKVFMDLFEPNEEQSLSYLKSLNINELTKYLSDTISDISPFQLDYITEISGSAAMLNTLYVRKSLVPSNEKGKKVLKKLYSGGEKILSDLKKFMIEQDINIACSDNKFNIFFKKGGNVIYSYHKEDGIKLFDHKVAESICKKNNLY